MSEKNKLDGNTTSQTDSIKKKLSCFSQNPYLVLLTVGITSLLIRLYYFPYDIPLTLDASIYFFYSTDMSILRMFPPGYHFPNNGGPIFVSFFFSMFHFDKFLDYMTLQRLITVSISVLTIIPLYFLCRRFFDKTYSLIGTMLFAFEPHIIQNSLLGLTEPLYIFLITASLAAFLSEKRIMLYISFVIAAFCSLVRYEGLVLFVVLTIVFFIRFKIRKESLIRYAIAVGVFILIITPMMYVRTQTIGNDGLMSQIVGGGNALTHSSQEPNGIFQFIGNGLYSYLKYLGWIMLPFFIFLVPRGMVSIFRNRNISNSTILLSLIILSIPALYAYSRGIQETRYLLVLIPLFSVVSIFSIKYFVQKVPRLRLFVILIIGIVLISSVIFLDYEKRDLEHEKDAVRLSLFIHSLQGSVNEYYPESTYVGIAGIHDTKFPALSNSIQRGPQVISLDGSSIEDTIKIGKSNGLSYLVIDNLNNKSNRKAFFNDIFYYEERYPYLVKIFDSKEYGYSYQVKIFKIDYEKFETLNQKS